MIIIDPNRLWWGLGGGAVSRRRQQMDVANSRPLSTVRADNVRMLSLRRYRTVIAILYYLQSQRRKSCKLASNVRMKPSFTVYILHRFLCAYGTGETYEKLRRSLSAYHASTVHDRYDDRLTVSPCIGSATSSWLSCTSTMILGKTRAQRLTHSDGLGSVLFHPTVCKTRLNYTVPMCEFAISIYI